MSRGAVIAHAVLAALVSLLSGWFGTGIVLCVVPPLLLVRFVHLDREATMVGAMGFTALLAIMAQSRHGAAGAVTVAFGGLVAAELAARGARIRRAAPLRTVHGEIGPTVVVVAVAAVATAITWGLATWRAPAVVAVAALTLTVVCGSVALMHLNHAESTEGTGRD